MSGLDLDDLRELRAAFLLDAPQRAARIELRLDSLEASDSAALRGAASAAAAREAHTLQGAAGTVGLDELAALAERLHDVLRTDAPGQAAPEARGVLREIKAAITAAEEVESAGGPRRLTVLHVEDNPLNSRLVERVLARRPGIRLLTATHGETALQLARERRPDLILLDLNLPDMSGVEVLSSLRDDSRTRDLAVVVVSGHEPGRTSQRLRELDIRDYLPKPIVVARLLELVDELAPPVGSER